MTRGGKHAPERGSDEVFSGGLAYLLRPIIRFCLRRSIKVQRFLDVVKMVYVEVGEEEMRASGHELSASRLSVMTGVHRKDVARLVKGEGKDTPASDILTRVLGQWRNDPRFSKANGHPRLLDLGGGTGEFAELVNSVSKELNPYTILFELERLQLASREGTLIRLNASEYTPRKRPLEAFQLVSADIDDVLSTAEENVFEQPRVPNLHLTTRYDNVCPQFLPEIRKWFMREGAKMQKKARNYLSQYDKDLNPKLRDYPGGAKVAFGTFSAAKQPPAPRKEKK